MTRRGERSGERSDLWSRWPEGERSDERRLTGERRTARGVQRGERSGVRRPSGERRTSRGVAGREARVAGEENGGRRRESAPGGRGRKEWLAVADGIEERHTAIGRRDKWRAVANEVAERPTASASSSPPPVREISG